MSTRVRGSIDEAACGPLAIPLCGLCELEYDCVRDTVDWVRREIGLSVEFQEARGVVVLEVVDKKCCARCTSLVAECFGRASPRFRC